MEFYNSLPTQEINHCFMTNNIHCTLKFTFIRYHNASYIIVYIAICFICVKYHKSSNGESVAENSFHILHDGLFFTLSRYSFKLYFLSYLNS